MPKWLPEHDTSAQSLQLIAFTLHYWNSSGVTELPAFTTIRTNLSYICWYHCIRYGRRPQLSDAYLLALRGPRCASKPGKIRIPITESMLCRFSLITDFSIPSHRVLYGATVQGIYFFLRRFENLTVDGRRHEYCIQVRDLHALDAGDQPTLAIKSAISVQLQLRGSKNDQFGDGAMCCFGKETSPLLCPVFAAMLLLQHAKSFGLAHQDPVCPLSKDRMISAKLMSELLRVVVHQSGVAATAVSTHSLRIGGTTALREGGADPIQIQQHGHWSSEVFKR